MSEPGGTGPGSEAARTELAHLRAAGAVEKVLLRPAEMGGRDVPGNVTWLPPACARDKHAFDARVQQQWGRSVPVAYTAVPTYEGDSLIPVRLALKAVAGDQDLHAVIEVARHRRPKPVVRRAWWKFW